MLTHLTDAERIRILCVITSQTWREAPWKLERQPGETDDAYKARSEAEAATHGLSPDNKTIHRFDHKPWSVERASVATPGWIGISMAPDPTDDEIVAAVLDGGRTYTVGGRLGVRSRNAYLTRRLKRLEAAGRVRRSPQLTYINSFYWERT